VSLKLMGASTATLTLLPGDNRFPMSGSDPSKGVRDSRIMAGQEDGIDYRVLAVSRLATLGMKRCQTEWHDRLLSY